ncbi:MAG: ATP-binding protein [Bacteroidetes bacterium]|nr:MAG: ATP-binding protein [Bacteroidota bacterium]
MNYNLQTYIPRQLEQPLREHQQIFPVVALLGPRQCGKSTLALHTISGAEDFVYLDLERPADLRKLEDPELFFRANVAKRFCLDEIQQRPDLFPVLRGLVDQDRQPGKWLLLGSASRDLIQQSSETLAGRIGYLELTPFIQAELPPDREIELHDHWLRGGFPLSLFQENDRFSYLWRENFIRTFIERDLPQLGAQISAKLIRRFLSMLAHNQGQLLNNSHLGSALGISHNTVRNYIDILEQAFILRSLPPFLPNLKKRLIKSPKVYLRDSGLLHSLLEIDTFNRLLGHPVFGSSWEGFVIENLLAALPGWQASFYRTSSGNEIDLILQRQDRTVAVEIKASTAPKLSKGFFLALNDLGITEAWVVCPAHEPYALREQVRVGGIGDVVAALR